MAKRMLIIALAASLLNLAGAREISAGEVKQDQHAKQAAKIKKIVARVGIGPDARVRIRTRDKRELKGYISRAGEQEFVLTDESTGADATIEYSQIEKVRFTPTLRAVLEKEFKPKRFAMKAAIAVAIIFGSAILICAASDGCKN